MSHEQLVLHFDGCLVKTNIKENETRTEVWILESWLVQTVEDYFWRILFSVDGGRAKAREGNEFRQLGWRQQRDGNEF